MKHTKLYEDLELRPTCSNDDIKKSYKRLALTHHPDKNINNKDAAEVKFKCIQHAYDILCDVEKRKLYDQGGEDGVKNPNKNTSENIFNNIFSGRFFSNPMWNMNMNIQQNVKRTPDKNIVSTLCITEMMKGVTKKIQYKRNVTCNVCKGSGADIVSNIVECDACQGKGAIQKVSQIMPNFMSQQIVTCEVCHGNGRCVKKGNECSACMGKRVVELDDEFIVDLPAGIDVKNDLTTDGKSDELPDHQTGNLHVTFKYAEETGVHRQGSDIIYHIDINLVDALVGVNINIKYVDHLINIRYDEVIQPNACKCIEGLGFPKELGGHIRGNLYVKFNVIFPKEFDDTQKYMIKTALNYTERVDSTNIPSYILLD